MFGMNLAEMGELAQKLPAFKKAAEELLHSARHLTARIDLFRGHSVETGDNSTAILADIFAANDDFKAKLAALPQMPGITIDG